jgi:hypothetical protein
MVAGGTVGTGQGVISYMTQPRRYFLQPARTYLLTLQYHSDGDWYSESNSWDLSSGIVRPNSLLEVEREREGKSSIANLTEEQLIRSLTERLSPK